MPVRVGIDLVSADDIRESISTHGGRYLRRIYSEREVSDCSTTSALDPERLATRFAAKEATLKVLRVGDEAVGWHEVEVRRDHTGWCELSLTGQAATLARAEGITALSLSLTHQRGCAAAVVVAEIEKTADA